jgi:hypothetical protein
MDTVALIIGIIAAVAIIVLGIRFFLAPDQATVDFGVAPGNVRALTEIKGARDITSGVVPILVWVAVGRVAFGWVLLAAALTPAADALIVITNGGKRSHALAVHGITAAVLVAIGLILALS